MSKLNLMFGIMFSVCFAYGGVEGRTVFEFGPETGDIAKIQVDLTKRSQRYKARVKSLLRKGGTRTGELVCIKLNAVEFRCKRDDGGGNFVLKTGTRPTLTTAHFDAADEDEDLQATLRLSDDKPITVEGKNAVTSLRDLF